MTGGEGFGAGKNPGTGPGAEPGAQPDSQSDSQRVSRKLLEALVCPATGGRLEYDAARGELISRTAMLAYPIRSGIPIMLMDEARNIDG